jgi:hypothetical protein
VPPLYWLLFNLKQAHHCIRTEHCIYRHILAQVSELQLSGIPSLEGATNKVVASTDEFECSLGQSIHDKWVGLQVSKGQIDSLLHTIQKMLDKHVI